MFLTLIFPHKFINITFISQLTAKSLTPMTLTKNRFVHCDAFITSPICILLITISFLKINSLLFSGVSLFQFGYCHDSDGALVIYWFLSFIEGILLLSPRFRTLSKETLQKPLPHVLLLLTIVTAVVSLVHEHPSLDFLGSAMLGEGILTFIGMLTSAISFSILTENEKTRRSLIWIALTSATFHALVVLLGTEEGWYSTAHELGKLGISLNKTAPGPLRGIIPHWFPDYIIFGAIPLITLFAIAISNNDQEIFQPHNRLKVLSFVLVTGLIVFLLNNVSLWLGLPLSLGAVGFMYLTQKKLPPKKWLLFYVPFGGALITLGILAAPELDFMPVNLQSRGYLSQITLPAWSYDFNFRGVLDFLFGRGWGTYDQLLTQNIDLLRVHQYQGDSWDPSWESFMRDQFHSHNVFLEQYVSLGIAGLLLGGYSLYIILTHIRRERLYLASFYLFGMTVLFCTWFQVLGTVTFGLLALTLLLDAKSVTTPIVRALPNSTWKILPVFLILMPVCGMILGLVSYNIRTTYAPRKPEDLVPQSRAFITSSFNHLDRLQGYYRVNKILSGWLTFGPAILRDKKAETKDVFDITKLYTSRLEENIKGKRMPHSRLLAYNLHAMNALHPKLKKLMKPEDFTNWKRFSLEFLDYVPQRASVMHLILGHYLSNGDTKSYLEILDKMERVSPQNPVTLWYRGLHLFQSDLTVNEGVDLMFKALKKGVNNFIPVDPVQREKIVQAHRNLFPQAHMMDRLG